MKSERFEGDCGPPPVHSAGGLFILCCGRRGASSPELLAPLCGPGGGLLNRVDVSLALPEAEWFASPRQDIPPGRQRARGLFDVRRGTQGSASRRGGRPRCWGPRRYGVSRERGDEPDPGTGRNGWGCFVPDLTRLAALPCGEARHR